MAFGDRGATVRSYRVWMASYGGGLTRYDGYVEVSALDEDDAVDRAKAKVRRSGMAPGTVDRVERRWQA